ncbi:class I SAM-dependent methyltransferase [Streptomyces sp. NBC_00233]|uniref:class I SAM-dependent methyltransferase n=1 Tax=Streptomyces sp. NBC_00233 TaxID=2975686 RepID=UPI00224EDE3D|nr:class I SAM-dependent methyltransferase [Streptomyces sp. NBC_00233]MCX5231889.1 class I SAM-dependent methyltransferase [Streptomyces sp. NBC_00233]
MGTTRMRRNQDADWDAWPVTDYLAENYRRLHPCDIGVIHHHAAVYRRIAPGSLARTLELGAGPNLYPLMLAGAASRRIDALEPSAANLGYLRRQLDRGPDASWQPFYALCRSLDPALPESGTEALRPVRVVPGTVDDLVPGTYDLASMNFVAESVTEDSAEFTLFCDVFVRAVRPGGRLLAAFMERMPSYRIGAGPVWPACPVDEAALRAVFAPRTTGLRISRVAKDLTLPEYGDTGILLLTAKRPATEPATPATATGATATGAPAPQG